MELYKEHGASLTNPNDGLVVIPRLPGRTDINAALDEVYIRFWFKTVMGRTCVFARASDFLTSGRMEPSKIKNEGYETAIRLAEEGTKNALGLVNYVLSNFFI